MTTNTKINLTNTEIVSVPLVIKPQISFKPNDEGQTKNKRLVAFYNAIRKESPDILFLGGITATLVIGAGYMTTRFLEINAATQSMPITDKLRYTYAAAGFLFGAGLFGKQFGEVAKEVRQEYNLLMKAAGNVIRRG